MDDSTRYGGCVHHVAGCGRYGWILLPDGRDVFLHQRALKHGYGHTLAPGAQLTFLVVEGDRGLVAVNAELIGGADDCAQTALAAPVGIG
jgi:cold shock CspA family protein